MTPCPRSGISSVGIPGTNKVLFFGGVQDMDENDAFDDDDDDEEDEIPGNFFNDLYSVIIENERATWNKLELSGKKDPTKKDKITEENMVNINFTEFFICLFLKMSMLISRIFF